jgi:hypothetical protein
MVRIAAVGLCLAVLAGCAGQPRQDAPAGADAAESPRWWYARFLVAPDGQGGVRPHVDLLLADRVLRPLLRERDDDLPLWRFHRRWPDDPTGHQFSFLFYAPAAIAGQVDRHLASDPLVGELLDAGVLRAYRMQPGDPERAAARGGSSDPRWSGELQAAWPDFIMGVSRTWLGLVGAVSACEPDRPDPAALEDCYRSGERQLNALWYEEGGHAFLHHLNAVFGYRPTLLPRGPMRF